MEGMTQSGKGEAGGSGSNIPSCEMADNGYREPLSNSLRVILLSDPWRGEAGREESSGSPGERGTGDWGARGAVLGPGSISKLLCYIRKEMCRIMIMIWVLLTKKIVSLIIFLSKKSIFLTKKLNILLKGKIYLELTKLL